MISDNPCSFSDGVSLKVFSSYDPSTLVTVSVVVLVVCASAGVNCALGGFILSCPDTPQKSASQSPQVISPSYVPFGFIFKFDDPQNAHFFNHVFVYFLYAVPARLHDTHEGIIVTVIVFVFSVVVVFVTCSDTVFST